MSRFSVSATISRVWSCWSQTQPTAASTPTCTHADEGAASPEFHRVISVIGFVSVSFGELFHPPAILGRRWNHQHPLALQSEEEPALMRFPQRVLTVTGLFMLLSTDTESRVGLLGRERLSCSGGDSSLRWDF